jgi:uncharacterized protein (DUF362 family)
MSKSIVSIVKGTDAERMIEQALDHLGGVKSLIKEGSTVVLKPNAGHPGGPESAINTSPEVVTAAIKVIQKAKPGKIILAEAAAIGCDTMECLEVSGIKQAALDAGVDDIRDIKADTDLVKMPIEEPTSDIKHVDLPRFLLEADHFVNLPIFKSHVSMVFSCALKNIKGVVQDIVHYVMHTTDLAAAMMDLGAVIQPDFTIADMIHPMEGYGPHSGTAADVGCILAGQDMVALDATACRIAKLSLDEVPYFDAALKKGLGVFDEDLIEIRGNSIAEVQKKLFLPYLEGFEAFPEYTYHVERGCSSCQGLAAFTMSKLKSLNQYDKNAGMHVAIGKIRGIPENIKDGTELLLFGDCTKSLKKRLEKEGKTALYCEGCPPGEPFPAWMMIERRSAEEIVLSEGEALRKRMEDEDMAFRKWVAEQSNR